MQTRKADAVFEGGGVKGIALVGAVCYAEFIGYRWHNVAGTSAGAIVAALLAAGYSGDEIHHLLAGLDYRSFCDPSVLCQVPLVGPALSLAVELGLYKGDVIESWLGDMLGKKRIRTFRDLLIPGEQDPRYQYRLQVIASDLSLGRMLVLPEDIKIYGQEPAELSVARAVRMSLSIPYFYEPVVIKYETGCSYVVDGGLLSNFPVWLFDTPEGQLPPWPTFGFRLVDPQEGRPHHIGGPVSMTSALVATMMEAHDTRYIEDAHWVRTIPINTLGIRTTDFDITPAQADKLFTSGWEAARKFFHRWNFSIYKANYRQSGAPGKNGLAQQRAHRVR